MDEPGWNTPDASVCTARTSTVCDGGGLVGSTMNGKNTQGNSGVLNAASPRWSYQIAVARVPVQAMAGWN